MFQNLQPINVYVINSIKLCMKDRNGLLSFTILVKHAKAICIQFHKIVQLIKCLEIFLEILHSYFTTCHYKYVET